MATQRHPPRTPEEIAERTGGDAEGIRKGMESFGFNLEDISEAESESENSSS